MLLSSVCRIGNNSDLSLLFSLDNNSSSSNAAASDATGKANDAENVDHPHPPDVCIEIVAGVIACLLITVVISVCCFGVVCPPAAQVRNTIIIAGAAFSII